MIKKIVITGGHLTPALAVIDELQKDGWQIIFFGRQHALEGDSSVSVEYQTITKLGISFISLTAGRLQRSFTRYTVFSFLKIPIGFIQSFYYLIKFKPTVILSFGGYVALPVALAGWMLKIPIVTHEQSVVPGLANKIIFKFAKKVCVSWVKTMEILRRVYPERSRGAQDDKSKFVLTGNPIRKDIFNINSRNLGRSIPGIGHFDEKLPLIYITGGSLGAHMINEAVLQVLPKLLEKYFVIHQCGDSQAYKDYDKLLNTSYQLPTTLKKRYILTKYVDSDNIGWVLNKSDLIISRAGANTVTELAALGKPAILIPLPWVGQNEQLENAKLLEQAGIAVILEQKNLAGESLYHWTMTMIQNLSKYKEHGIDAKQLINLQATENLIKVVNETI